jgi:carboxylesterase
VLRGAEPWSHQGEAGEGGRRPAGVLLLHELGGSPRTVRSLGDALAAAGFAVDAPLLPGHGTCTSDLAGTGWLVWVATAEEAYRRLSVRSREVVVAGLCLGGTLAVHLACHHPELAGMVCINALVEPAPDRHLEQLRAQLDAGRSTTAPVAADIADPDAAPVAYDELPVAALLSLHEGVRDLAPRLGDVTCPLLLVTSADDHVVDPSSADVRAAAVAGPVERVRLARSFHVATVDVDRAELEAQAVGFARKVTAS